MKGGGLVSQCWNWGIWVGQHPNLLAFIPDFDDRCFQRPAKITLKGKNKISKAAIFMNYFTWPLSSLVRLHILSKAWSRDPPGAAFFFPVA